MGKNAIEIIELSKKYKSNKNLSLNHISLSVKEGEFFAFLGVNGAGKSTTINIISTLISKTSGGVFINGLDLDANADAIKEKIGVVFQKGILDDDLTVLDNLLIRGKLYNLNEKDLKKNINNICNELNMSYFINNKYGKLSGGEKRKADIARALILKPRILFLDEPTTGLDPKSRLDLWKIIKKIYKNNNMTIFLTTHYMEEVNDADRIAIIDKGNILAIDTPETLKSKYSNDTIKLTVSKHNKSLLEKKLDLKNIKYDFVVDTFIISIQNGIDFIEFINDNKKLISSVQILKGDMDNVFLNIVGRKLENE